MLKEGKQVTIIEMLPELMRGGMAVPLMNRLMIIDLLAMKKVKVITDAYVRKINEGYITIGFNNGNQDEAIYTDSVVIASGLKADNALYKEL